jgi:hypothetical protein
LRKNANQKEPSNRTAHAKNCSLQLGTAKSGEEPPPDDGILLLYTRYTNKSIHSNGSAQYLYPKQYAFYQYSKKNFKKAKHQVLNHHKNSKFDFSGAQMFPISQK